MSDYGNPQFIEQRDRIRELEAERDQLRAERTAYEVKLAGYVELEKERDQLRERCERVEGELRDLRKRLKIIGLDRIIDHVSIEGPQAADIERATEIARERGWIDDALEVEGG